MDAANPRHVREAVEQRGLTERPEHSLQLVERHARRWKRSLHGERCRRVLHKRGGALTTDESATVGGVVADPRRRLRAPDVLGVLLTERNAADMQRIAEQGDLVVDHRKGCAVELRRGRQHRSPDAAGLQWPQHRIPQVPHRRSNAVQRLLGDDLPEEVHPLRVCRWALEAHRPERRILAAIVEVDVPVLDDDGPASASPDDLDHLAEGLRVLASILGDQTRPVVVGGRVRDPAVLVRICPGPHAGGSPAAI
jgi:hypothetical protein